MNRLLAFLARLLTTEVPWQQRLGAAAGPWNVTGAKNLARHMAQATWG